MGTIASPRSYDRVASMRVSWLFCENLRF